MPTKKEKRRGSDWTSGIPSTVRFFSLQRTDRSSGGGGGGGGGGRRRRKERQFLLLGGQFRLQVEQLLLQLQPRRLGLFQRLLFAADTALEQQQQQQQQQKTLAVDRVSCHREAHLEVS